MKGGFAARELEARVCVSPAVLLGEEERNRRKFAGFSVYID